MKWVQSGCFITAASLMLLGFPPAYGDALDTLHLRNPVPKADVLQSIGFGNGKFVATDNRHDIFASEDGFTWAPIGNSGTTNPLQKIVYGSGRYVANTGNNIFSSEDGAVWTVRASQDFPVDIAYGNGVFVAISALGAVMTSPDGISWTAQNSCNCAFRGMTFGNGIFAVVEGFNKIHTSTDGVMWTSHIPDAGYTNGSFITYGNGKFVVSGGTRSGTCCFTPGIWHSANGSDWFRVSGTSLGSHGLMYANETFLSWTGYGPSVTGNVLTSPDGLNWATNALPAGLSLLRVAYGNGIFVSVNYGPIGVSSNGVDWTKVVVPMTDRSFFAKAGAYGAGRYVLVGTGPVSPGGFVGSVVTSSDGINYTRISNSVFPGLNAVLYAGGQFVAAGQDGAVLRSPDGLIWNTSRSGTLKHLHAVTHGAGRYVAVGEGGTIRISEDGIVWTAANSGTDYSLHGVAFANDKFVSVGQLGIVLTSADGITWTPQNNPDFSTLYHVTHAEGRFLAVGGGGAVLSSTNGATWTRHPSGMTDTLNRITYAGGLYVAVSSVSGVYDGRVFTSTDGATWTARSQPNFGKIAAAAFLNNTFVLFGVDGVILQSDPVGGATLGLAINSSTGALEAKVRSEDIGRSWRLQSCTNLPIGTWFDVTKFVQTQPVMTIPVPWGTGTAECYYRIVSP